MQEASDAGHAAAGWCHTPHGADVGLEAWGPDLASAFEQAALGLVAVSSDPAGVRGRDRVEVNIAEDEPDGLLFDWLNSVVYEMATRRMLFATARVRLSDHRLSGELWGEPVDVRRHAPAVEVKGPTFTGLSVGQEPGRGWVVRCVVDV